MNFTHKRQPYREIVKETFKEGNKLMKKFVSGTICPLGDMYDAERALTRWTEKQPAHIKTYFENAAAEAIQVAYNRYHRPVVRGRDGVLYSHSDMDDVMMMGTCN